MKGYTRTSDGYLGLVDEISSYFYAQVGIGKYNQIHLCEIFAALAEVSLVDQDWTKNSNDGILERNGIVVHVGASETHKSVDAQKWISILSRVAKSTEEKIFLIGSKDEEKVAEKIMSSLPEGRALSLVGKLSLFDSFKEIQKSKLLVGADSAPIHMAALADTPVCNLSSKSVNFYETGPRSSDSSVFRYEKSEDLDAEKVAWWINETLFKRKFKYEDVYYINSNRIGYQNSIGSSASFEWDLICSIYFLEPLGILTPSLSQSFEEILRVLTNAIDCLGKIKSQADVEKYAGVLSIGDTIIDVIGKKHKELLPFVWWFQSNKVKIPPGNFESILSHTTECYLLAEEVVRTILNEKSHKEVKECVS